MAKSAQAFRTIREVADWLDVAAHVLRFWESKFNQIKPVKRAGGRRYYRPADMELVGGIKVLLHERGMTIRGVQKLISEEGLDAVKSLSPPIDELLNDDQGEVIDLDPVDAWDEDAAADTIPVVSDGGQDKTAINLQLEDTVSTTPDTAAPLVDETDLNVEQAAETSDIVAQIEPELSSDQEPVATASASVSETETETETPVEQNETGATIPTEPLIAQATSGLPKSDPAEGHLGALAALAALPSANRAGMAPHIAALSQLRDRMASPVPSAQDHS